MRFVSFVIVAAAAVATTACSKGGASNCTGVSNSDPPFCLDVSAKDFSTADVHRFPEGGDVAVKAASYDKGAFLIRWYPASDYDHELSSAGGYGGTKAHAKKLDQTGKDAGRDWAVFTDSGTKIVISLVKTPKAVIFCTGTIAASSPTNKIIDACKTLR
jgi:hypothetical protein